MNAEEIRAYARDRLKKMEGDNLKLYNSIMEDIKKAIDNDPTCTQVWVSGILHPSIKQRLRDDDFIITTKQGGYNETDTIISWASAEASYWENR